MWKFLHSIDVVGRGLINQIDNQAERRPALVLRTSIAPENECKYRNKKKMKKNIYSLLTKKDFFLNCLVSLILIFVFLWIRFMTK